MAFIREFKEFITRGNVVDMAVGVVVGSAFKGIVDALVDHIIMPVVGVLISGISFEKLGIVLSVKDGEPNILAYGKFINAVVNFLIIALCLFLVIKGINKVRSLTDRKKEEEAAKEPEKVDPVKLQNELLTDILSELKKQNSASNNG